MTGYSARVTQDEPAGGLPVREITPNMVIAYNITRWRKANGMTQEQLGDELGGWTKGQVSAAERSWDGKRVRQFDADLIADLASILRVPVPALFMPPEDDGESVRYVITGRPEPVPMDEYFSYLMPEPDFEPDTEAGAAYLRAVITAIAKYGGNEAAEQVAAQVRETAAVQEIGTALKMARDNRAGLDGAYGLLAALAEDNALLIGILERALTPQDCPPEDSP